MITALKLLKIIGKGKYSIIHNGDFCFFVKGKVKKDVKYIDQDKIEFIIPINIYNKALSLLNELTQLQNKLENIN